MNTGCVRLNTWSNIMRKFRIHPGALCRQLLSRLETHPPLSASQEAQILSAIKSCPVPDATDRILSAWSRRTLRNVLEDIQ